MDLARTFILKVSLFEISLLKIRSEVLEVQFHSLRVHCCAWWLIIVIHKSQEPVQVF